MAVSFEKKLDLIRKANATLKKEKITTLLGQASKIDSYSTENQTKIKGNVDSLYKQIAEAYAQKKKAVAQANAPVSKARKKPKKEDTMMGYASMVMKRDNITWKQALKKSKDHFADIRTKKQDAEKKALEDFEKKVGAVDFERATKYKTRNGTKGTDIERDKVRPALPSGKRIVRTKGKTTNQYGTYNNKIGKVYYEKRANRMDINQPSKSVYPKLADGGQISEKDIEKKAIFYTDESRWSTKPTISKFKQDIVENEELLHKLKNKEITPSKIIGRGFKPSYAKKIAENYLNEQIMVAKKSIEILESKGEKYANGGKIIDQYNERTPEDIWNNLSKSQRQHFLYDHIEEIEEYKGVKEELPSSEIIKAYNSEWKTLDKDIKNRFANHTRIGQYAKGGEVSNKRYKVFVNTTEKVSYRGIYYVEASSKEKAEQIAIDNYKKEFGTKRGVQVYVDSIKIVPMQDGKELTRKYYVKLRNQKGSERDDFIIDAFDEPSALDRAFKKFRTKHGRPSVYNDNPEEFLISVDDIYPISEIRENGVTTYKRTFAEGGKIGFDALAKKVARSYKGKKVKAKYQDEYGKTYDSKEAMEVGQKVASKVYRKQLARKGKMAKGGSVDDLYVAVGEKDGYWTILSKPSSEKESQKLLRATTLPRGYVGKVVSIEDAKKHKSVIGREYLMYNTMTLDENDDLMIDYSKTKEGKFFMEFLNEMHKKGYSFNLSKALHSLKSAKLSKPKDDLNKSDYEEIENWMIEWGGFKRKNATKHTYSVVGYQDNERGKKKGYVYESGITDLDKAISEAKYLHFTLNYRFAEVQDESGKVIEGFPIEKYYAKGGKVDNKKYNFTIVEYKDVDAVLDDELTDGDDFYGTKQRVIEVQEQRMQRGYCVYFAISNGEGWYYESEDLDELKESLENSEDDDYQNDEYAKEGKGFKMAKGGGVGTFKEHKQKKAKELKEKISEINAYLKKLENINSEEAFEEGQNLRDVKAIYEAQLLHLEDKFAKGGEIAESNRNMALNKAKELCHHVDELHNVLKGKKHIEAWVIAKLERASSDLSDVTHYLDGLSEQKTH